MKKVYVALSLFAVVAVISCGNNDTTAEGKTGEQEQAVDSISGSVQSESNAAPVIEAYAKDKSGISTADIDTKDTSFTTRSKTLYSSDENGKKLAVVYGFKATPKGGVAIIEVEGEKPLMLKQVETAPGVQYEFTNGTVTLKRTDKAVQLNENGELVTYKEIL